MDPNTRPPDQPPTFITYHQINRPDNLNYVSMDSPKPFDPDPMMLVTSKAPRHGAKSLMLSNFAVPFKEDIELIRRIEQQNVILTEQALHQEDQDLNWPSDPDLLEQDKAHVFQFSAFTLNQNSAPDPEQRVGSLDSIASEALNGHFPMQSDIPAQVYYLQDEAWMNPEQGPSLDGAIRKNHTNHHQHRPPEDIHARSDDPQLYGQPSPVLGAQQIANTTSDHENQPAACKGSQSNLPVPTQTSGQLDHLSLDTQAPMSMDCPSLQGTYGQDYDNRGRSWDASTGDYPYQSPGDTHNGLHLIHNLQPYRKPISQQYHPSGIYPAPDQPFYGQEPCHEQGGQVPHLQTDVLVPGVGYAVAEIDYNEHQDYDYTSGQHNAKTIQNGIGHHIPQEEVIEDGEFLMEDVEVLQKSESDQPVGDCQLATYRQGTTQHVQGSGSQDEAYNGQQYSYHAINPSQQHVQSYINQVSDHRSGSGSGQFVNTHEAWNQDHLVCNTYQTLQCVPMDSHHSACHQSMERSSSPYTDPHRPIHTQTGSPQAYHSLEQVSPGSTSSCDSGRLPTDLQITQSGRTTPTQASARQYEIESMEIDGFQRAQHELLDDYVPDNLEPMDYEYSSEASMFDAYADYVNSIQPLSLNTASAPEKVVKKRKGRGKNMPKMTEEEKKALKRLRNQKESERYREKKKSEQEEADETLRRLKSQNGDLADETSKLESKAHFFVEQLQTFQHTSQLNQILKQEQQRYLHAKANAKRRLNLARHQDEHVKDAHEKWKAEERKFEDASAKYTDKEYKSTKFTIGGQKSRAKDKKQLLRNLHDILINKHNHHRNTHLFKLVELYFKRTVGRYINMIGFIPDAAFAQEFNELKEYLKAK